MAELALDEGSYTRTLVVGRIMVSPGDLPYHRRE